jgi:hypothetical protein
MTARASISKTDHEAFRTGEFLVLLNLAVGGNFPNGILPGPDFRKRRRGLREMMLAENA